MVIELAGISSSPSVRENFLASKVESLV